MSIIKEMIKETTEDLPVAGKAVTYTALGIILIASASLLMGILLGQIPQVYL